MRCTPPLEQFKIALFQKKQHPTPEQVANKLKWAWTQMPDALCFRVNPRKNSLDGGPGTRPPHVRSSTPNQPVLALNFKHRATALSQAQMARGDVPESQFRYREFATDEGAHTTYDRPNVRVVRQLRGAQRQSDNLSSSRLAWTAFRSIRRDILPHIIWRRSAPETHPVTRGRLQ